MRWWPTLVVALSACRAPPASSLVLEPSPAPVVVEQPPPPPPPVKREFDTSPLAATLVKFEQELLADAGVPLADQQIFPDDYSTEQGVFTFRGGPKRTGGAWGVIPASPSKIEIIWSVKTGESKAPWFGGSGWTGQPVIVRWPAVVRHSMSRLRQLRYDDDLVEVIQGSLDGNVYFIDLRTGRKSRTPLVTGNPIKGSVSLDPRGYPLLFVGQGIPENKPIGLRVFDLISHEEVFFLPGNDKEAPRRGWGAFDSSGLLNRKTDTYVVGGENGLVYLLKLNTNFDPLALTLKVAPEVVRYKYHANGNKYFGVENSLTVARNLAFFADNGGTLQGVDLRSFTPLWSFEAGDDTDATIALDLEEARSDAGESEVKPKLYTGCEVDKTGPRGNTWLRKLDGLTGTLEWERPFACLGASGPPKKIDAGVFATPAVGQGDVADLVFFTLSRCPGPTNGVVLALDKATGKNVWRFELPNFSWSTPTLLKDAAGKTWLLQGEIGGVVHLIDARTGVEAARVKLEGDIESSPAAFDDYVVLGTRANRIYGLRIR